MLTVRSGGEEELTRLDRACESPAEVVELSVRMALHARTSVTVDAFHPPRILSVPVYEATFHVGCDVRCIFGDGATAILGDVPLVAQPRVVVAPVEIPHRQGLIFGEVRVTKEFGATIEAGDDRVYQQWVQWILLALGGRGLAVLARNFAVVGGREPDVTLEEIELTGRQWLVPRLHLHAVGGDRDRFTRRRPADHRLAQPSLVARDLPLVGRRVAVGAGDAVRRARRQRVLPVVTLAPVLGDGRVGARRRLADHRIAQPALVARDLPLVGRRVAVGAGDEVRLARRQRVLPACSLAPVLGDGWVGTRRRPALGERPHDATLVASHLTVDIITVEAEGLARLAVLDDGGAVSRHGIGYGADVDAARLGDARRCRGEHALIAPRRVGQNVSISAGRSTLRSVRDGRGAIALVAVDGDGHGARLWFANGRGQGAVEARGRILEPVPLIARRVARSAALERGGAITGRSVVWNGHTARIGGAYRRRHLSRVALGRGFEREPSVALREAYLPGLERRGARAHRRVGRWDDRAAVRHAARLGQLPQVAVSGPRRGVPGVALNHARPAVLERARTTPRTPVRGRREASARLWHARRPCQRARVARGRTGERVPRRALGRARLGMRQDGGAIAHRPVVRGDHVARLGRAPRGGEPPRATTRLRRRWNMPVVALRLALLAVVQFVRAIAQRPVLRRGHLALFGEASRRGYLAQRAHHRPGECVPLLALRRAHRARFQLVGTIAQPPVIGRSHVVARTGEALAHLESPNGAERRPRKVVPIVALWLAKLSVDEWTVGGARPQASVLDARHHLALGRLARRHGQHPRVALGHSDRPVPTVALDGARLATLQCGRAIPERAVFGFDGERTAVGDALGHFESAARARGDANERVPIFTFGLARGTMFKRGWTVARRSGVLGVRDDASVGSAPGAAHSAIRARHRLGQCVSLVALRDARLTVRQSRPARPQATVGDGLRRLAVAREALADRQRPEGAARVR